MKKKFSVILGVVCIALLVAFIFVQYQKNQEQQVLDAHNEHINVGRIKLGMSEKEAFEILNTQPEKEMCVYGYEFNFVDRGLNLGFRVDNNTLRRITVKNTTDELYGIHNQMAFDEAKALILEAGFKPDELVKNRFKMDDVYFTIVSKKGTHADQIILEVIDDAIVKYAQ